MHFPFCGLLHNCISAILRANSESKFWHQINLPVSRLPVLYSVILRLLISLLSPLSLFCCSSPRPLGGWVSVRSHQCSLQCSLHCWVLTHTAPNSHVLFSECWDLNPSLAYYPKELKDDGCKNPDILAQSCLCFFTTAREPAAYLQTVVCYY